MDPLTEDVRIYIYVHVCVCLWMLLLASFSFVNFRKLILQRSRNFYINLESRHYIASLFLLYRSINFFLKNIYLYPSSCFNVVNPKFLAFSFVSNYIAVDLW